MKKAYYYLFYQLYKFWDYVSVPKFWTDFKAAVSIVILEVWSLLIIVNSFGIRNGSNYIIDFINPIFFLPLIFIILINYILFIHYKESWKNYNDEFDNIPKRNNIIGGIVVWTIVLLIIFFYFFTTFKLHKVIHGKY